ncbi:putative leader peptide [Yinghuangia soli]
MAVHGRSHLELGEGQRMRPTCLPVTLLTRRRAIDLCRSAGSRCR